MNLNDNKFYITMFLLLLLQVHLALSIKIHILDSSKAYRVEKPKPKASRFTKICNRIFSSFQYFGKDSFDIYKGCRNKYELLPLSDNYITKENPKCFNNLNKLFCQKYLKNEFSGYRNQPCGNEETFSLVLKILKGCVTVKLFNF